jgi:ABC-2 type transport system ATP-binding protein
MLEISHLRKVYEDGTVGVDDLSLAVSPGEICVLLGANGAGKTSTIMLILGFTEPTEGTVKINGIDIQKDPLAAKQHVAYVSENVMLYGNFTARQNLAFFTELAGRGKNGDQREKVTEKEYREVFRRVGLADNAYYRRVKGFSKGMRQRLGIAIAILKRAPLIVLDEPTSGLDPKGGFEFLEIIAALKLEGCAILMSSHDIFRVKSMADRVGIMRSGKVLEMLDREEIEHRDLQEIYLEYMKTEVAGATSAKVL